MLNYVKMSENGSKMGENGVKMSEIERKRGLYLFYPSGEVLR